MKNFVTVQVNTLIPMGKSWAHDRFNVKLYIRCFFLLSNEEEKQNDEKSYKIHISFLFFCFVFQAWNLLATRAFIQKPLFIPFTLIVQKKSKIFKCLNKLQQHKKKTKAHKPLEERDGSLVN